MICHLIKTGEHIYVFIYEHLKSYFTKVYTGTLITSTEIQPLKKEVHLKFKHEHEHEFSLLQQQKSGKNPRDTTFLKKATLFYNIIPK